MAGITLSKEIFIRKIYSAFFKNEYSADLILVVVWLAASIVSIYIPNLTSTPIRIVFALPVVLFIPGYCLVAALFPKNDDISVMERIALSVGLSAAIIPMIGLGLNFTSWGIRLDSLVLSLTLFTWVMILVAHYRRAVLPFEERFRIPFSEIAGVIRKGFFPLKNSKVDHVLNATLAIVIFIAILTTIYVIASPKESEHFSEFFILGENKTAADYPDLIATGQNYPIFIGVGNHEYKNMTYTIETWTSLTEFDNVTNSTSIMAMDSLDRQSLSLGHNETRIIQFNLFVKKPGNNRVEFLLFNETVPDSEVTGNDRINASYRNLHLWMNNQQGKYPADSRHY